MVWKLGEWTGDGDFPTPKHHHHYCCKNFFHFWKVWKFLGFHKRDSNFSQALHMHIWWFSSYRTDHPWEFIIYTIMHENRFGSPSFFPEKRKTFHEHRKSQLLLLTIQWNFWLGLHANSTQFWSNMNELWATDIRLSPAQVTKVSITQKSKMSPVK